MSPSVLLPMSLHKGRISTKRKEEYSSIFGNYDRVKTTHL